MDSRQTLVVHATFEHLLLSLKESHQRASLLVDENGLSREEGFVLDITETEQGKMVLLDHGRQVPLLSLVAVNGLFLSDYSEC